MNSLTDLNHFSKNGLLFDDERPFGYEILINGIPPGPTPWPLYFGNLTISEGQNFTFPNPVDFTKLVSLDDYQNTFLRVIVPLRLHPIEVVWEDVPEHCSVTVQQLHDSNVMWYTVSGFKGIADYNRIKNPIIVMPMDYVDTWYPTGDLYANGIQIGGQWKSKVTVNDFSEITEPIDTYFDEDYGRYITGYPQVTDIENENINRIYQITITASDKNALELLQCNGIEDYETHTIWTDEMVGNTRVQQLWLEGPKAKINYNLSKLFLTPAVNYDQTFTLYYSLHNGDAHPSETYVVDQVVAIRNTHDLLSLMDLDRTYQKNYPGKLFATNVPQILENLSSTYVISFKLNSNIGFIGLGESLISPVGWDQGTLTYTFTGNQAQCNTTFQNLRFFANKDVYSDTTITYRQERSSVEQVLMNFNLLGQNSSVTTGGNTLTTVSEDTTINSSTWNPITFITHYSDPIALMLNTTVSSNEVNNVAAFGNTTGWTVVGNATVNSRIYKNLSAATTITEYLTNQSPITANLILYPDFNGSFEVKQSVGVGSTYNGTSFVGGNVTTVNKPITVTGSDEYTLTTEISYTEDQLAVRIPFSITDSAVGATYTLNFQFYWNGGGGDGESELWPVMWSESSTMSNPTYGGTFSLTGSKSALNAKNVYVRPPPDYTPYYGWALVTYSQSKVQNGITVVQANNVFIHLNQVANTSEYTLTNTYTFLSNSNVGPMSHTVTDVAKDLASPHTPSYSVTFRQLTPDPVTYPGYFLQTAVNNRSSVISNSGLGNAITITGNASQVSSSSSDLYYYKPVGYEGTVTLGYSQTKTSPYTPPAVLAQASNVVITCRSGLVNAPETVDQLWLTSKYLGAGTGKMGFEILDPAFANSTSYFVSMQTTSPYYGWLSGYDSSGFKIGSIFAVDGSKTVQNDYLTNYDYYTSANIGNVTVYTTITRLTGGNVILANNVTTTITVRTPNVDELWYPNSPITGVSYYPNYIAGGNYAGVFSGNHLQLSTQRTGTFPRGPYYGPWSTLTSNAYTIPPNNSFTNGLKNCDDLLTWMVTTSGLDFTLPTWAYNGYPTPSDNKCLRATYYSLYSNPQGTKGYSGYYLPSRDELIAVMTALPNYFAVDTIYWSSSIVSGQIYYVTKSSNGTIAASSMSYSQSTLSATSGWGFFIGKTSTTYKYPWNY